MKKLIVFAAIAVAAVASQAAAVSWSYVSSSNEKNNHIYLIVGSTLPTSIDNINTWLAGQTVVSDATVNYNAMSRKSTASGTATSDTITKDKSYYFVMVDAAGENFKATGPYAGTAMVYDPAQQESAPANTDFASSDFAAASWTAVGGGSTPPIPEPTSGILMIVGLGALALRRRKA